MSYENLPGQFGYLIDGNLQVASVSEAPIVFVLGTSARGTDEFRAVDSVSSVASEYGRQDGTLIKGLYEVLAGGASNIRLMRVGAKSAKLESVGTGITIETVSKDADAGSEYKIYWDDTAGRLYVWRVSDDRLVYDNNPVYPSAALDEFEVSVSGTASGSPGNIGTAATPAGALTLVQADAVSGALYTAGDDGIQLSRMELFEAYHKAYQLVENEDIDIIVPRNAFLDDKNVQDMTTAEVVALNVSAPWASSSVYPEPGSFFDALGKVFTQEYNGEWQFWWDLDRDGIAEIYPSVGAATASIDALGNALDSTDFHEANFGYQLADFCYRQSENHDHMIGFIGMKPPISWSLKDVSNWIGREPVTSTDSTGVVTITTNGTGLFGNKWMAGRLANVGTGLLGHVIGGVSALYRGGFIATDSGWPDGDQVTDRNDHLVDLGKYISVVAGQGVMANPSSDFAYVSSGVGPYAGLVSNLSENSAPTNKVQPGLRLPPFRISGSKLDALAGYGYVTFRDKPRKGAVVSDAPTAARPDSDFTRLSTVRIVKATIDAVRAAGEDHIGEGISGVRLAALETGIEQALVKLQKAGYLQRFDFILVSTPSQQIQGKATVELVLVPAFELRQISIYVALSAQ